MKRGGRVRSTWVRKGKKRDKNMELEKAFVEAWKSSEWVADYKTYK